MYDRPFRWWVQSVMPLVFDDSLSYYEVLAKLTKYIEGLTGDVEQIEKVLETIEGIGDITQFTEFLESIQAQIGDLDNLQTQTKASLVSAINEVALKADIAYWKPPTGIPESDLSQEVQDKLNRAVSSTEYIINNVKLNPAPANNSPTDLGLGTYTVPDGGIPWNTLSSDVRDRITGAGGSGTTDYEDLNNKPQINGHTLNAGDNSLESLGLGTYSKPSSGIPESDLSAEVQEKLNTSGGIADSQDTFVASRDYEAGELVYINGVLYKTRYRILSGTTMIPGNNIETTDISAELEKINSDIESLQSGAGPDSWVLTDTVQSLSNLERVDFFEYFNCIGGESYSFIVEPVNPSTAVAYTLDIRKRDGTVASSHVVTNTTDYMNRLRFTFTPSDSGEYYCTFYRNASGYSEDTSPCKVTIEYTQSQGISELWNQVNNAIQLGADIPAIETVVGEHTEQLATLDDIPDRVETLETQTSDLIDAVDTSANFNFVHVVSSRQPEPYNLLNGLYDCGLYSIRGSEGYLPSDVPVGFTGGSMLIIPAYQERTLSVPALNQPQKLQFLIDPVVKKAWMRYANASNVWRDWFSFDLTSNIADLQNGVPTPSGFTSSSFVTGGIAEGGGNSSNSKRIRTGYIAKGDKTSIRYEIPEGYRLQIAFYSDNSGTQVARTNWMTGEGKIGFTASATYFRLQFASIGDSITLTPADDYNRIAISYGYALIDVPPFISEQTKWLAVGDSITYGVCSNAPNSSSVGTSWARFLASSLGYTMYNMGVRGMGYVTAGSNGVTWADTLDSIDALTDEYNLVTIMLGINDYNNSSATLESIATALNTGLDRIIAKYPNARLIVFTPFNACNRGTAESLYDYGYGYPSSSPRTLKDIADKIIETCTLRGIECYNVTIGCLLHAGNMQGLLLDTIHPSQDCHKLLSKAMAKYLIY